MSYFPALVQNIIVDASDSVTGYSLGAGATWNSAGTGASTLGVAGIQFSMTMNQDGIVYIDQGPDGTNWYVIDSYTYATMNGGLGITIQSVDAFVRTRVKNTSLVTATLNINTILCPIIEALPRSLDEDGHLKVGVKSLKDEYGWSVEYTPMAEMRVVIPTRLVGIAYEGNTVDTNFWDYQTLNSSSISQTHAQLIMASGTELNGYVEIQSVRRGRYVGGYCNRYRAVLVLSDLGLADNTRRWGAWDGTDGAYFELTGTTMYCVTMKDGVATPVASTAWNSDRTVPVLTNVFTCEIYWTNSSVWFSIGGDLKHKMSASTTTWTGTLTLPVRAENSNGGNTTDCSLRIRTATIYRLGQPTTRPIWKNFTGTVGTDILKYSAGTLQQIIINTPEDGAQIYVYDALTESNQILKITLPTGSQPLYIDYNLDFYYGLTIKTSSATNLDITIVYE